jgi:hypothetical protein
MNAHQNLTLSIHSAARHGADDLRDDDLVRLCETWPELRAVFEEVQYLRRYSESLEQKKCRCDDC